MKYLMPLVFKSWINTLTGEKTFKYAICIKAYLFKEGKSVFKFSGNITQAQMQPKYGNQTRKNFDLSG